MYATPRLIIFQRSLLFNKERQEQIMANSPGAHSRRIKDQLEAVGVTKYGLWKQESRYLPRIIHTDELIGGVVYGHYKDGSAMLIATDKRVIFLDKKPMFVNADELTYDVVSGVNFSNIGAGSVVTLHTRIKEFTIRTFNKKCAQNFVHFIESRRVERNTEVIQNDYPT